MIYHVANTMNGRRELFSQNKDTALRSFYRIATATMLLFLYGSLSAQTPVVWYNSYSGKINYTMIGGSLRTDSLVALKSADTCTLTLPGQSVNTAYLYWCGSGSTPDDTVLLHGQTVVSSKRDTVSSYYNGGSRYWFSGFADVTSIINTYKSGSYIFTGLRVDNTSNIYTSTAAVVAGWAVVVIYNDTSEVRHTINIYKGLRCFKGDDIILSPNNFYVPFGKVNGKMTHITWEGDQANSDSLNNFGENLAFDGQILTDQYNPIGDQFNSASNTLYPSKGYTYGTDIDTYDITPELHSGDTLATSVYSSGADNVILNSEIISIADTSNSDIAITKTTTGAAGDSIVVANKMHYILTVTNNGPDTTGTITVVDTLQPGAKLDTVSAPGWSVDSLSKPIYTFKYYGTGGKNAPNVSIPAIDMRVYIYYDPASYKYLRNSASASSPQFDRRPYNNLATKTIKVVTPVFLQTTKTFYDYRHYPNIGDTLRYTIRVKNSGNWDVSPAHSNPVTVVDSLPAGFAYITGAPGTAPTASGNVTNGYVLTWTNVFTTLVQGASDSVRYWVIPNATFTADSLFINRANVSCARC